MNSKFKLGDTVKVLGVRGLSRDSAVIIGIRERPNGIELDHAVAGFRFWNHDDLVLFPTEPAPAAQEAKT